MRRTALQQEIRKMRFEEVYGGWQKRRLSQEEAAQILGVSSRTFRRYINRYDDNGLEGLSDRRLGQSSHRRAPVDEVMALGELYQRRYRGWNVNIFTLGIAGTAANGVIPGSRTLFRDKVMWRSPRRKELIVREEPEVPYPG